MSALSAEQVLALVPQQRPFRFLDRLAELDDEHVIGEYTWRAEDCRGYTPDGTIVPPFALLEMAAQIGSVAWTIHHMAKAASPEEMRQLVGVFTEVPRFELLRTVRAGQTVAVLAEFGDAGYFRGNKLVAEVTGQVQGGPDDGQDVFRGVVAGMWVPRRNGG